MLLSIENEYLFASLQFTFFHFISLSNNNISNNMQTGTWKIIYMIHAVLSLKITSTAWILLKKYLWYLVYYPLKCRYQNYIKKYILDRIFRKVYFKSINPWYWIIKTIFVYDQGSQRYVFIIPPLDHPNEISFHLSLYF